jgi:DNA invertase Pin-like site-specific DNA recombinase
LGWGQVVIIDEDLGKSGATAVGRLGFQRLVAAVSLGQAGAVFGLEVSRLARNNRDWYQLLDLCALMNTLIVDAEGVYDPRQLNDRLLLGLKGTMSEAELGWIRQRAHEGLLAKARRGALILGLPVGYIATRDGRIEKHPDQRVQAGVALVFTKFAEMGSVRQALLWFRQEQVRLPAIEREAPWGEHVTWRLPVYNTLRAMLANPTYAGAYAFGRTGSRTTIFEGEPRTSRGHRRPAAEWRVLLRDHHATYISWEVYERNQALIAHNAQMKGLMVRGAVRRGPSLLAGLLRCAHCGRRLHVSYSGRGGGVPRYACRGAAINHGAGRCIAFGGLRVDAAVEQEVLRVLAPGAIEAAMATAASTVEQTTASQRAVELELREAQYEAERARRQDDAVEPEHRLVAATLEARWNAAMARVQRLEERLATLTATAQQHTPPDRAALLKLAEDFPRVWGDPATDMRTKKRLVRLLIEGISATARTDPTPQIELLIHWAGGKHTQLVIPRNRPGQHRWSTERALVDVVREIARVLADGQVARVLNRLGYRTGAGNTWTQARVATVRHSYQIPPFDRTREQRMTLTLAEAATALNVSTMTVRKMIVQRLLPATQPVMYAPWVIQRADLQEPIVQRAVEAVKRGRGLPRSGAPAQLTIEKSLT